MKFKLKKDFVLMFGATFVCLHAQAVDSFAVSNLSFDLGSNPALQHYDDPTRCLSTVDTAGVNDPSCSAGVAARF